MHNRSRYLRGGVRAVTGIAVLAAGALTVTALATSPMPEVRAEVPAYQVTTEGTSQSTIVCQGSFGVLGLNPSSPNDVTPVGEATTALTPGETERLALAQELPGATPPEAFSTQVSAPVWGAQSQRVSLETVRGMTASACGQPTTEQWLVGGSTERGMSSVITVANPGRVPATVTISVFDEQGQVTGVGTSGVLVAAGAQKTVPLNGFGTGRVSPAVHIQSTGSPVFATLGVQLITDITPIGADTVNSQMAPAQVHAFPGIKVYENHTHGEEEGGHNLVTIRMLAPEQATDARVYGVTSSGDRVELATAELEAGVVQDIGLTSFQDTVTGLVVESDDPIVAGVMTVTHDSADYDFTWMAPSTVFDAGTEVRAVTLEGATLTLMNVSAESATFAVGDTEIELPAHAARTIKAAAADVISGDAQFALGGTLFDEQSLSTYPILGTGQQLEGFTVYTR